MSRPFYTRKTKSNIKRDIDWLSQTYDIPLSKLTTRSKKADFMNELNRLLSHPNRMGSYYMVKIRFKYRIVGDSTIDVKEQPTTSFTTRTKNPDRNLLLSKAYRASLDYARSRTALQYEPEILDVKIISVEKINNIKTLANIPAYRLKLNYPNLNFFDDEKDSENQFTCGFAMLMKEYPKRTTKHNLETFFDKTKDKALTPLEIMEFCKFINVSCFIVDMNCQEIVKYISTRNDRHREDEMHALVASVASNHYYLIKDEHSRSKIINQVCMKSAKHITGQNVMQPAVKKEIEIKDQLIKKLPNKLISNTHYYLETDKLNSIYFEY